MSFERILDYFAERAIAEIPHNAERMLTAASLRESYARLKITSSVTTLDKEARAIYGVTRLAGTLSALRAVLSQWSMLRLEKPRTILDCGSGPGTALFAAHEIFGDEARFTAIEKDAGFIAIAQRAVDDLLGTSRREQFSWIHDVVPSATINDRFDLAILSYMLSETPENDLERVLTWVCERARHVVITDAGTPSVYRHLMMARDILIARGWQILAPCPHQKKCPMIAPDFCHFSARFHRTHEAKRLKSASAQAEDEKYCYVIAAAPEHARRETVHEGRIVKKPLSRTGHRVFDICATDGTLKRIIKSKKHGDDYRRAKNLDWGDVI